MLSDKSTSVAAETAAAEKRKNARSGLVMEDLENRFSLLCDRRNYAITKVRDVSISGVGLEAPHPFQSGDQVSLVYDSGDLRLSIGGTVMWCQPQSDGVHALGIQFDRANRQDTALFFLAIRKYLDEFDGTYIDA